MKCKQQMGIKRQKNKKYKTNLAGVEEKIQKIKQTLRKRGGRDEHRNGQQLEGEMRNRRKEWSYRPHQPLSGMKDTSPQNSQFVEAGECPVLRGPEGKKDTQENKFQS